MGQLSNIVFIVAIIAAFWFLIIRPQQQRTKQQAEMVASLAPGAKILTIGGIYATIVSVDEDRLRVEVADGSQLEISKRAVGQVLPADDAEDDEADADAADDAVAEVDAAAQGDAAGSDTDAPQGDAS